jgi:hypothetical protein
MGKTIPMRLQPENHFSLEQLVKKLAWALSLSTIMLGSIAHRVDAEVFKTARGVIIVTDLEPNRSYPVQTLGTSGRAGTRNIKTNACGILSISNGDKYTRIDIGVQRIEVGQLPVRERQRCNRRRNSPS